MYKIGKLLSLAVFAIVWAASTGSSVAEASVSTINLSGSPMFQFVLLDTSTSTADEVYTLPSTTGNHGMIKLFKVRNGTIPYMGIVEAPANETLDGSLAQRELPNGGDYITLIADEVHNTWWIINIGNAN